MVTLGIYNNVVTSMLRDIAKTSIDNLMMEYLIESQFITMFNHSWLRKEVQHTVSDAIDDIAIMDIIDIYCDEMVCEAVPMIAKL